MEYLSGADVREPIGEGRKIIGHCCNDLGKMGSGVALALLKKWPNVRSEYINWAETNNFNGKPFSLGEVQFVSVEEEIVVANIIGQHDIHSKDGVPPVRYKALEKACNHLTDICHYYNASIHFPYLMGCDLAGGDWDIVEKIIMETLVENEVEVFIYDLYNKRK